ncbi:MAG: hypothetical protein QM784_05895 [Polyangiaceae bacterium]
MATSPTIQKREREKAKRSRQIEKDALRKQRREARAERKPGEPGVDPDIAGIVPGPQPVLDEDQSEQET